MRRVNLRMLWRFLLVIVLFPLFGESAIAQTVTEDTSSVNTQVTLASDQYWVTGGSVSQQTLFHSFETFSPDYRGVIFDLTADATQSNVQRILGRVTGDSSSSIRGLLKVIGGNSPDLFLFNPNGITLEGAYLDLPGSFRVSTANSLSLGDNADFGASAMTPAPALLQISAPIGLQYGADRSFINVRNIGLGVRSGQSLGLFGGAVNVMSAGLEAPGGSIDISGESVNVMFAGLTAAGGNINIAGESVDLRGIGVSAESFDSQDAGGIRITGNNVSLRELSIAGNSFGDGDASSITVAATETLFAQYANLASRTTGNGAAGDITLSSDGDLTAIGVALESRTAGGGAGGDVGFSGRTVLAEDVNFTTKTDGAAAAGDISFSGTESLTLRRTNFGSDTNGRGRAGAIAFSGGNLLLEGSSFGAASNGSGQAGFIDFQATNLTLINSGFGSNSNLFGDGGGINISVDNRFEMQDSGLGTDNYSSGLPGDVTISAADMVMYNSGVGASTRASGDAGAVTVTANNMVMTESGIDSEATVGSTGNAGSITLTIADSLALNDSAVGTEAKGSADGRGGQITIYASDILLREQNPHGRIAEIDSQSLGSGDSGGIDITTNELTVEGGIISVANFGAGTGGLLHIDAQAAITVSEQGSIFAANGTGATGIGSSIVLNTTDLNLQGSSRITVATGGEGMGGSLTIAAGTLQVLEGSSINASSMSEIGFTAEETYILSGDEIGTLTLVTPTLPDTAVYGDAGDVVIAADRILVSGVNSENTASRIEAFSETNAAAGTIDIVAGTLQVDNLGEVTVSGLGEGNAGNLVANAGTILVDNGGSLQAQVTNGDQGNLFLSASDILLLRRGSRLTTNATATANGGNIRIQSPVIVGLENSDIVANAISGDGGRIDITTQGILGLAFRDRLTDSSDITASSESGVKGTVDIQGVEVVPDSGLVILPEGMSNEGDQVAKACSETAANQFVASGRGGLLLNPSDRVASTDVWSDVRDVSEVSAASPSLVGHNQDPSGDSLQDEAVLVEATHWRVNADATVSLLGVDDRLGAAVADCGTLTAHR